MNLASVYFLYKTLYPVTAVGLNLGGLQLTTMKKLPFLDTCSTDTDWGGVGNRSESKTLCMQVTFFFSFFFKYLTHK